ncbi:hypothetical protein RCN48_21175 [Escherichia marmotae]|nr:hypothetical protein [Escherichia marmotae]MED9360389.1 hypothetical protein [Escherichia marmotae]
MKRLFCVLVMLSFTGCTTEWVRNRPDAENLEIAMSSCEEQAEAKYPVKNEIAQESHYESIKEKCYNKSKCNGEKYREVMRPVTDSSVIDVNQNTRETWFEHCMEKKGWHMNVKLM